MMAVLLAVLCQAAPVEPVADVYAQLRARGVSVEPAAAARASAEAVVRLADPGARFFDEAGAAAFEACRGGDTTNAPALRDLGEGIVLLEAGCLGPPAAALAVTGLASAAAAGGGFILDCRGAGGTNLAAVDALAAPFVRPDTFLYSVQNGLGEDLELHAAPEAEPAAAPVIMLVDRRTTGAAELLAAVLARNRGVLLVGQPTKGDPARRELVPLAGGGAAFMATGRYVLPDDTTWAGTGVAPHVRIAPAGKAPIDVRTNLLSRAGKPFDESARRHIELFAAVRTDPGLARAVDLLLGLKALAILPEKTYAPVAAADPR
jgi:hypothetical protein